LRGELFLIALVGLFGEFGGGLELFELRRIIVGPQFSSTVPAATSLPDSKRIWSTTPDACAARSAPRTARKLPMACVRACQLVLAAVVVETV